MIKNIKFVIYIILALIFSFCSNTDKLKENKTNPEATILEKEKQSKQDSLENLKKEIQLLKKKKDSIINKSKGIL